MTQQPADSPPDPPASPPPPVGAQPLVLWHQRLGHLNYYDVRRLLSLADGIPITKSQKSVDPGVCPPCLMGKHHKTYQRRIPAARTESPLALVHSDTGGPFRRPAISGAKHFILFIDDYTRMTLGLFSQVYKPRGDPRGFPGLQGHCGEDLRGCHTPLSMR